MFHVMSFRHADIVWLIGGLFIDPQHLMNIVAARMGISIQKNESGVQLSYRVHGSDVGSEGSSFCKTCAESCCLPRSVPKDGLCPSRAKCHRLWNSLYH